MMKSMRSTWLIYTCALLSIAALSACDAKSTESSSDASEPTDVAKADSQSAPQEASAESAKDQPTPQSERPKATSPKGGEVAHEPPLSISNLLKGEDLKALSAAKISTAKLAGKAATPTYNSARFYPKSAEIYGVGLQVWTFEEDSVAVDFVAQLRAQYLGVKDAPADAVTRGDRAFLASRAGIENYIFAPETEGNHVLAISCSQDFCKNGWADIASVAATVQARVAGDTTKDAPKKAVKKAPQKDAKKTAKK